MSDDGHPDPPGDELAEHGYTGGAGRAVPHEPEAVDVDDLHPRWRHQADERHEDAGPTRRRRVA